MGKSVHRGLKAQKCLTELSPIQSSDIMRLFLFIAIFRSGFPPDLPHRLPSQGLWLLVLEFTLHFSQGVTIGSLCGYSVA
jgi:hypothetical protein